MTSTIGNSNTPNFSLRHRGAKMHSSKQRLGKINSQILSLAMIGMIFLLTVFANFVMVHKTVNSQTTFQGTTSPSSFKNRIAVIEKQRAAQKGNEFCQLRNYPPHRYYLHSQAIKSAPSFLNTETEYIFGQWPILFQHSTSSSLPKQLSKGAAYSSSTLSILSSPPRKLCVDQSEWNPHKDVWPFADGTNPSILSIQRIQQQLASSSSTSRRTIQSDFDALLTAFPEVAYVATICMTNSQCTWRDSAQQIQEFRLRNTNQTQQPDAVLTVIQLLTHDFIRIAQATLILELDAPWGLGRQRKTSFREPTMIPAFDDARLFLHNGQIWVSYREGKLFGYESQVLNPIHWNVITDAANNGGGEEGEDARFSVSVKASETTSFCCGRNMALMENLIQPQRLQALTWVDPVTVETVDTTPHVQLRQDQPKASTRRLRRDLQRTNQQKQQQQQAPKKSHIHGTNAFMVYLPDTKEFLGIGHFHRPNDRKPNPYARFGHHYTHNFYTISSKPPYRLTGLSPEFVLTKRGASWLTNTAATGVGNDQNEHVGETNDDAHIIQFVSGLELVVDQSMLVLAYGINDCEAAVTTLSLDSVRSLLRPVPMGKQVVDFMQQLTTTTASSSAKI